jgi:curved DNA-binding protein CbpA
MEETADSSQEELKKLYHKLAKKFHPDLNGGDCEMMKKLNIAYAEGDIETLRAMDAEEETKAEEARTSKKKASTPPKDSNQKTNENKKEEGKTRTPAPSADSNEEEDVLTIDDYVQIGAALVFVLVGITIFYFMSLH